MDIFFSEVFSYAGISLLMLWGLFTITFVIAYKINIWKILDIAWGLGFVFVVLTGWGIFWDFQLTQHLWLIGLVTIWGLRLSIHLGMRGSKKEDSRYEKFKDSKHRMLKSYINIFLSQALFIWLICLPFYFYIPIRSSTLEVPINTYVLIFGVIISITGLFWEWTADYQLKHFKEPGKLVDRGLWKYTRHPNYFGEILFWWGIWIGTHLLYIPQGYILYYDALVFVGLLTVLSPLTITCIIYYLTGPILEEQMKKYPDWEAYKLRTPYILPFNFFRVKISSREK